MSPLADFLRPQTLADVVGQSSILGQHGLLTRIASKGALPNMLFYGPCGTGKTTVAEILAKQSGLVFKKLNATTADTSSIKAVLAQTGTLFSENILLYVDEIHYFNKRQQQTLLDYMETGRITLIASTTENPFFAVFGSLLSRATLFEFKPLSCADILTVLDRGAKAMSKRLGREVSFEPNADEHIASSSGGDCRKALNALELCANASFLGDGGGGVVITLADAVLCAQRSAMRFDHSGDTHFDSMSALQKSIRGSDPDAALYYLSLLLNGGAMLSACRRLLVTASEDIGLAYPLAAVVVKSCVDSAIQVGMPEARYPLSHAALTLALAPKSNSVTSVNEALADASKGYGFPRCLQNVHADGQNTGVLGQGYLYPHDYPDNWVRQQYMPPELDGKHYYTPGENKNEQLSAEYWRRIKNKEVPQ